MRKIRPDFSPPDLKEKSLFQNETLSYKCKLITPLYGGGVKAGEVDTGMAIRATTIRGQLRFWWRIAHKKNYADTKEMFIAERDLWGGLGDSDSLSASKVIVKVINLDPVNVKSKIGQYADFTKKNGNLPTLPKREDWAGGQEAVGYSLFPCQEKMSKGSEKKPSTLLKSGVLWELEINFKSEYVDKNKIDEVKTAVRWWSTFGSVGARGRRGLGSVFVEQLQPINEEEALEAGCKLVFCNSNKHYPHPDEAWRDGIEALRTFRQGKGFARNLGSSGHPGRSRWPEPDAIRKFTRQQAPKHELKEPVYTYFPRAYFGLPIIFHFKDSSHRKDSDPGDTTLIPKGKERMASPLIIHPYASESKWKCAALFLGTDFEKMPLKSPLHLELELKGDKRKGEFDAWPSQIDLENEVKNSIRPLKSVMVESGEKDPPIPFPIKVFLEYFKDTSKLKQGC